MPLGRVSRKDCLCGGDGMLAGLVLTPETFSPNDREPEEDYLTHKHSLYSMHTGVFRREAVKLN